MKPIACMTCALVSGIVALIVSLLIGAYMGPRFAQGVRALSLFDVNTDPASQDRELCSTQRYDAFLFHMTNWEQVRLAPLTPMKPVFEEVGPFNFTRRMCIFDRQLVPGSNPPTVTQRRYYGDWVAAAAKPEDLERRLNFVNPAYVTVISKLRRDSPTPLNGIEGERSLHGAICSSALKAITNGLLAPMPDGFLATTYIGAIPAVMTKVIDTLGDLIDKLDIGILPLDGMSKYRAARYLWARPMTCGNYSTKTGGCLELAAISLKTSKGLDLDKVDSTIYEGFEVGTPAKGMPYVESTISPESAEMLWNNTDEDALRNPSGIIKWNVSREDSALASRLREKFLLSASDFALVQNWVAMFSTVTPSLVVPQLLGSQYTEKDANLLVWAQFGEGIVTAQRGNRPDGFPKTVHDVNSKVPITFEISHWARTVAFLQLPIFTPSHLEFMFSGTTKSGAYAGRFCEKPLFDQANMFLFFQIASNLASKDMSIQSFAASESDRIWSMTTNQTIYMNRYLEWLMSSVILNDTGPVVTTTVRDILFDREDPLLKVLVTAGKLKSPRSGVLYSSNDFKSKEEARANPPELERRVFVGPDNGFAVTDTVPQSYIDALSVDKWRTTDADGKPILVGPVLKAWKSDISVSGFSGERFPMPVSKDATLDVWNDAIARTLRWNHVGEEVSLEGINTMVFKLAGDTLKRNDVFYQGYEGMFNVSALKPTDVFVSLPRFANVDLSLVNVDLPPSNALQCCKEWRLFVQPDSGVTMGKDIATQINFQMPQFGQFARLASPASIMPLVWLQDRVVISPEDASKFKDAMRLVSMMKMIAFIVGPVLCVLCCIGVGLCAIVARRRSRGKEDEYVAANPIAMNPVSAGPESTELERDAVY